ncbi:hypothetical protein BGZ76_001765, partial [Entomortierella beljakovae]
MQEEKPGMGHIVPSSQQGIVFAIFLNAQLLSSMHKIITLEFSEIQQPVSHHSQNEKSIERLPKRELSASSLTEQYATPNKKPSHSVQFSSTSTQNDEVMIESTQLYDTETPHHDQHYPIQYNISNTIIYQHQWQPNMPNTSNFKSMGIEGHSDFTNVQNALATYYKVHLGIQRVSGEKLELEKCYVNLAIVEAIHQQQIDRELLNEQSKSFIRMQNYENVRGTQLDSTIQIKDLFNERKLRDGRHDTPKKILIQGRAGIGKTTFCKKLIHLFINGGWNDRFHAIIWIPLRQLKTHKSRNLEDLLKEKYFAHHSNFEKVNLVNELLAGIQHKKVLFVLDGLDEIISDAQGEDPMGSFVKYLLYQTHVIITSRPSGVDRSILPVLDLELETVGFSSTNISDYVNNVLDGEAATSVIDFIQKTPIVQTLANIPVQLDVICYSWESLPKDDDMITVTKLYQSMVDKLYRKDGVLLEKSNGGRNISINTMKGLKEYQVSGLMSTEIEYLTYLAFIGMENNQIEFDNPTMQDAIEKLDHFQGQPSQGQLPIHLLEIIKQTSFLHAVQDNIDPEYDHSQQSYHFIHLTFQEFFAAIWLSKYFQNEQ